MDITTQFLVNHSEHFVASRLATAQRLRYGNGSRAASMIAVTASGIRRSAATIERWARGGNAEVVEYRLPRQSSAR
jgi:hypothetical protein